MRTHWTKEKEQELINMIKIKSVTDCAIYFNVTEKAIKSKCGRLKISIYKNQYIKTKCFICNSTILDLISNNRKFCSRKCSATYNNSIRTKESREKQKETLLKTLSKKPKKEKVTKIKKGFKNTTVERSCKSCNTKMYNTHKQICESCKTKYYSFYRQDCNFNFKINEFSFLFSEKELHNLKQNGMYSASNRGNNINGISRDHKFSVKEGYILNIKPFILSHPANCELLHHVKNNRKKTTCSISLLDLYNDIIKCEKMKRFLSDDNLKFITSLVVETSRSAKSTG